MLCYFVSLGCLRRRRRGGAMSINITHHGTTSFYFSEEVNLVYSHHFNYISPSPPTFQYRHCRNHRPQIPLPHSNPNAHRPLHPLLRTILPPSQIRHHQLTHQKIKIDPLLLLQKVRRCLQSRQGIGSQHQSRRSQGTNAR